MLRKRNRMLALIFGSIFFVSLVLPPLNSFEVNGIPPAFFSINILVPNYDIELVNLALLMREQLPKIGIGVSSLNITDAGFVADRTFNHHGPYPIPPFAEGGYDIVLLKQIAEIDYDPYFNFHSTKFPPTGDNFYQYSRPEMDWAIGNYSQSFVLADRISYAHDIQALLYEDEPAITIHNMGKLSFVNPDFNKSSMNSILWSLEEQQMHEWMIPGKNEFRYAVKDVPHNYHPFFANHIIDKQWLNQVFTGLIERNENAPYNNAFGPFVSRSVTSPNGLTYEVQLETNAKWADGHILNASDVKYSFDLFYDSNLSQQDQDFYSQYLDNESVVINSEYNLSVYFKRHYVFQEDLLAIDLLPKHIWELISPENHNETAKDWAINQPEKIFGAGPYKLHSLDPVDGFVHLTRNDYFDDWYGTTPYFDDIYFVYFSNKEEALVALNDSLVDMVDQGFDLTINDNSTNYGSVVLEQPYSYEIAINCLHPYIGTGELAPIWGGNSGNYMRQAISHTIPRELILTENFDGIGSLGITPYPNYTVGFDNTLLPFEYSIDIAKQKMELAGFVYPYTYSYDSSPIWLDILTVIGILLIPLTCIFLCAGLPFFVASKTAKESRKLDFQKRKKVYQDSRGNEIIMKKEVTVNPQEKRLQEIIKKSEKGEE